MQAKFVYEAIGDIFKPKSEEEIWSLMGDLDPDDLFLKSAEIGFLPGMNKALEDGTDVHTHHDYALRRASTDGHYDIVKLLLDHGANVHAIDDWSLRIASQNDYYDIVKLLLDSGADVHANNDQALQQASANDHYDVIELLKKYM